MYPNQNNIKFIYISIFYFNQFCHNSIKDEIFEKIDQDQKGFLTYNEIKEGIDLMQNDQEESKAGD
jgi:hypothetical protein